MNQDLPVIPRREVPPFQANPYWLNIGGGDVRATVKVEGLPIKISQKNVDHTGGVWRVDGEFVSPDGKEYAIHFRDDRQIHTCSAYIRVVVNGNECGKALWHRSEEPLRLAPGHEKRELVFKLRPGTEQPLVFPDKPEDAVELTQQVAANSGTIIVQLHSVKPESELPPPLEALPKVQEFDDFAEEVKPLPAPEAGQAGEIKFKYPEDVPYATFTFSYRPKDPLAVAPEVADDDSEDDKSKVKARKGKGKRKRKSNARDFSWSSEEDSGYSSNSGSDYEPTQKGKRGARAAPRRAASQRQPKVKSKPLSERISTSAKRGKRGPAKKKKGEKDERPRWEEFMKQIDDDA